MIWGFVSLAAFAFFFGVIGGFLGSFLSTKFKKPQPTCPDSEKLKVLNKNGKVIFKGESHEAIEWIINHPVEPELIRVDGLVLTVDTYLHEWDLYHKKH